jgi:hypothetical protein
MVGRDLHRITSVRKEELEEVRVWINKRKDLRLESISSRS